MIKLLTTHFERIRISNKNVQLGASEIKLPDSVREILRECNMLIGEMESLIRIIKRGKRINKTEIFNPIGFRKWLEKGGNSKYTTKQKEWIRETEKAYRIYLDARDEIKLIASELGRIAGQPSPEIEIEKPNAPVVGEILNPFKLIPNVKKFTLGLEKGVDLLLLDHGLLKKIRFEPKIEPYRNDSMNRYINYSVGRLHKARSNPTLYWRIVTALMLRSTSFIVCAFNNKYPNWQRKMRWSVVLSTIDQYLDIVKNRRTDLEFYRFYVPKSDGRSRPIGAPVRSWKLFLHMLNQFLVIYLAPHQPPQQHGFWPGRGTLTMWENILSDVLSSRNIVEFDLRQFFEKVRLKAIAERLRFTQVPEDIIKWIVEINLQGPELPEEQKVDETLAKVKNESRRRGLDAMNESAVEERTGTSARITDFAFLDYSGYDYGLDLDSPEADFKDTYVDSIWEGLEKGMDSEGVPQGAPTSPLLATLALQDTLFNIHNKFKTIMYADDGLIHGDDVMVSDLMEKEEWKQSGIEIHPEKSHQVKKDGVWLRPLKILGLEYNGETDKFYANTRNGASLEFDKHDLIEALKHRESPKDSDEELFQGLENWAKTVGEKDATREKGSTFTGDTKGSWIELAKSSIFGLIQARMYGDAWNDRVLLQDFKYSYEEGSWAAWYRGMVKADLRNSSSLGCFALACHLRPTWKSRVEISGVVVGKPTE